MVLSSSDFNFWTHLKSISRTLAYSTSLTNWDPLTFHLSTWKFSNYFCPRLQMIKDTSHMGAGFAQTWFTSRAMCVNSHTSLFGTDPNGNQRIVHSLRVSYLGQHNKLVAYFVPLHARYKATDQLVISFKTSKVLELFLGIKTCF